MCNLKKACRNAINARTKNLHQLYNTNRPGKFWNIVRKSRMANMSCDAVSLNHLHDHFKKIFSAEIPRTPCIDEAESFVSAKYNAMKDTIIHEVLSESRTKRLIKKLKKGCSPGLDGITAEHLSFGVDTQLPLHLSMLLTLCIRFGRVPKLFSVGKLIPILKKPHLNPCDPSSYRPITVSSTLSKMLELYILECSDHTMHPCQFGFVSGRGTNTAISLSHDVSAYCISRGSTVYMCSLDAEGAFDGIPHPVLFRNAAESIPDHCWRVIYYWYTRSDMSVIVRWGGHDSEPIKVKKGTRQGGLTSPFLFNCFYRPLIAKLNSLQCGIRIIYIIYNVFCYADDILLASSTPSGLQTLINESVTYATDNGLRFNPAKTMCVTLGRGMTCSTPTWTIDSCSLDHEDGVAYLGAVLRKDRGASHVIRRTAAAQKAFYGLQAAGLHFNGVEPFVASKLYTVGVRTVLTYGAECIDISKSSMKKMERLQGKLIKSFLGLRKSSHTTPLLAALCIPPVERSVGFAALGLLRSCILGTSNASQFYIDMMTRDPDARTLTKRCCDLTRDIDPLKYIFDDRYFKTTKKLKYVQSDGLSDSISFLLSGYNLYARENVQCLVNSF